MRFFLDEEFIEDGLTIDLVSIGIVADNEAFYYAECSEFDENAASPWVKEHVLSQLQSPPAMRKSRRQIAEEVVHFVAAITPSDEKPEFWGYYADYDWVCLCQLYGTMMDLPKGWPMYCRDIKQLCDSLGNPVLPPNSSGEHFALMDARWNKRAFEFLLHYGHQKFQELASEQGHLSEFDIHQRYP